MTDKPEETASVDAPATGAVTGVVIPAGSPPAMPMSQQPKMGGKCCGCCCDYRKAVIILSIIGIIIIILQLAIPTVRAISVADDDVYNQLLDIQRFRARINRIIAIVGLCMNVCNLIGAATFVWPLNFLYLLWAAIQFGLSVFYGLSTVKAVIGVYQDADLLDDDNYERITRFSAISAYIISGAFLVLWVYPTTFFISECSRGVLTKETYPREEFSCCCSPRR